MNGVLILDKPFGITSMTAVEMVRRAAGGEKCGHAGTLDPRATGVLVVALGKATGVIEQLMTTDKRYHTQIDLTAFTTTDDLEGERLEVSIPRVPSHHDVVLALQRFIGEFEQRPPAFSAVKVGGQRAYKLARRGAAPVIDARPVVVRELNLISYQWPVVTLEIASGKGFYVRSLARDLGEALRTGGHCVSIRRTAVGPFTIDMAKRLDRLHGRVGEQDLLTTDHALSMLDHESARQTTADG